MKNESINEIVDWNDLKRIFEICNTTNIDIEATKTFFSEIPLTKFNETISLLNNMGLDRPYTKKKFVERLLVYILKEYPDFFSFSFTKDMKILSFSISIRYYVLRNLLLQMKIVKKIGANNFVFEKDKYQNDVAELVKVNKRKKTLKDLLEDLENKANLGDIAEQYVLRYEQKNILEKKSNIFLHLMLMQVMIFYLFFQMRNILLIK